MNGFQTSYLFLLQHRFHQKNAFSFIQLANVTDFVEQIILTVHKSLQNAAELVKVCSVYLCLK